MGRRRVGNGSTLLRAILEHCPPKRRAFLPCSRARRSLGHFFLKTLARFVPRRTLCGMRVLVTGGTGFIGSNLARHLQERGDEVFITGTTGEQDTAQFADRVFPLAVEKLDWEKLGVLDAVFHQAANNDTTVLDRNAMTAANVDASRRLFDDAVRHGCRRIVYASSCSVYGDLPAPYHEAGPFRPLNPYAESKALLDLHAMAFARMHPEVAVVGLRYSNVYGPGEEHKGRRATMITQFARQMSLKNPRLFRSGEQKRDYIFIEDVVRANVLAAKGKESCVVNCGSGSATSFNDLVAILNEVLGLQRTPEYIENPYAGRYQNHTECDMSLVREKIGFVPSIDIRTGIRRYYESGKLVPFAQAR